MFGELYAEQRTDVNQGHAEALDRLCAWLEAGDPFCHIRFADGEFNAICETEGPGWDEAGVRHRDPGLRDALRAVLHEIAAKHPHHGRLLIGGDWSARPEHRAYLVQQRLLRRIPWVPSSVFVDGIESGAVLRWLRGLQARRPVVLVGCAGIRSAATFMGARFIEVPAINAWDATRLLLKQLRLITTPGSLVIFCAGQAAKPWAWLLWTQSNGTVSVVDMGHFFDLACGMQTRAWHEECVPPWSNRKERYLQTCAPLIYGVS